MSKKSLLISVDANEEPNLSQDVEIRYSDDDAFRPVEDINIFGSVSRPQPHETNDVKFNIIIDPNDRSTATRRYRNPRLQKNLNDSSIFPDDDFINSEENKIKRLERAKRFNLETSVEQKNTGSKPVSLSPVSQKDLDDLYDNLQLDINDRKIRERTRLNSVYVRGLNRFSTQDVFDYFSTYDPEFVEWIDDNSCNIVWNSDEPAARAMTGCSFPLKLIKKVGNCETDEVVSSSGELEEEDEDDDDFISPLKRSADGDVSIKNSTLSNNEGKLLSDESTRSGYKENADGTVTVDSLHYLVPPGFIWRIGHKSPLSKLLLLRFSTTKDVKDSKSESKSEFYRKHGNPNFGNAAGIISRSKRERIHRQNVDENFKGHIDYNRGSEDLRSKLRNVARWNEIRTCNRRNSDEEHSDTAAYYSPYSDQDELESSKKDNRRTTKQRPLRMKMRADDVQRKQVMRKRQADSLLSSHARAPKRSRRQHNDDSSGSDGETAFIKSRPHSGYHDVTDHIGPKSQSPVVDVRTRLEQYRMKITVENEPDKSDEGEINSDDSPLDSSL